mmetsp:Transcript_13027/g.21089  ORF Transcript_13027/g.21089 Transcript_13027/m.21089 type:complete len:103 (+) Transcript_13027:752-1060(+)
MNVLFLQSFTTMKFRIGKLLYLKKVSKVRRSNGSREQLESVTVTLLDAENPHAEPADELFCTMLCFDVSILFCPTLYSVWLNLDVFGRSMFSTPVHPIDRLK